MTTSRVEFYSMKYWRGEDCLLFSAQFLVLVVKKVGIKKLRRQIVKAELNIDQTWSGLTPTTS